MTYRELLDKLRDIERQQGADRLDDTVLFVTTGPTGKTLVTRPVRNVDWADASITGAAYGQLVLCEY